MELLVKNGRVIDYTSDFVGDIYINNGIIEEIGYNLQKDCDILDAKGYVVTPAFVDLHSHFRDPGLEYKEDIKTGSRAAVRGGYTTVNLMGNTKPVCSDMRTVNYVVNKAKEIGLVDAYQTVSITRDLQGKDISHLEKIDDSVKCISDDGKGVNSDRIMHDAMVVANKRNFVVMSHAEDEEITPISTRLSENMMTERDITLAKFTGCHLHLSHVSTKEAMKDIIEAKKEGFNITCEVTPHHIALTGENLYKVNPPIREAEDVDYIINAIRKGYVDAIGTDHAPHSKEDKEKGACGISGIETSFSVCYTKLVKEGNLTINKLSEIMSKNPADILNINKGKISIGYEGDLAIIDLDNKYTVDSQKFHSKGKNTPFNGMELYGTVIKTIRAGKIVFQNM
ncbi:dihydroorotase [Clostridium pasteurianum DSM 525 = ATCC 6013]|uniref:Dihydroorotase n=1 Tax=Clostridium pasteurianum DSM 525 = ATCC 6013 TaxID=1262449 RepID=A0A0H3J491_CLOPA|nr:dihydroorotase [Clostridium pasteurianum]AJA48756.1 dihydroorotase [Clostridium pasteurianum DSM 525 = ATCC 6013]AJA52744.1 dihydroorotase [Clostridium pasteurianum DSM 525 = ATCC 6013]AOZ75979.1 dihydroorotase [Clostridium pasteurianum DSM 525 = ATCC 6013]AOZ79775.1 dihydroorotase [Clostridium pasteurianum]ELP60055.1 dihydroorotase, multifunctional complex type [Clostridium pasteurianum DSM 525 = ATCC 6013]